MRRPNDGRFLAPPPLNEIQKDYPDLAQWLYTLYRRAGGGYAAPNTQLDARVADLESAANLAMGAVEKLEAEASAQYSGSEPVFDARIRALEAKDSSFQDNLQWIARIKDLEAVIASMEGRRPAPKPVESGVADVDLASAYGRIAKLEATVSALLSSMPSDNGGTVVHRWGTETIHDVKTFTHTITSSLGTIITSTPELTSTATWNAAGTTFVHQFVNITATASATASLLYDYQVDSVSRHKLQKNGQTWFTVSGAGDNIINIGNAAGTNRYIRWDTAGSRRWQVGAGSGAESGGDAGSAFNIAAYDDSGNFISTPISIARVAGGFITIGRTIQMGDALNFILNTTTGTKFGTGTTQKLAFYNSTPLAQQANTVDIRTALINLGFFATGGANPLNLNGGALTVGSIAATGTVALTDTLTVTDAKNFVFSTDTGTQIGTGITQKMGFYGVTPIAQRAGAAQAAIATTAATNVTPYGYTTAAQADAIVTLANELRAWAVAQGFIKGSA